MSWVIAKYASVTAVSARAFASSIVFTAILFFCNNFNMKNLKI
jgi:hypothetical protein